MNKPAWKAVNARLRKERIEAEKRKRKEEQIRSWEYSQGRLDFRREMETLHASVNMQPIDYQMIPFETRLSIAKSELIRKFSEKIVDYIDIEHHDAFYEVWEATLTVIKPDRYERRFLFRPMYK